MVEVSTCLEERDEVVWIGSRLSESELDGDAAEDVVREAAQHGHWTGGGRGWVGVEWEI